MPSSSALQAARKRHAPQWPAALDASTTSLITGDVPASEQPEKLRSLFPATFGRPVVFIKPIDSTSQPPPADRRPMRVGCILSGGQAPGGHNVIAGLFDFLQRHHPDSRLYGFKDGPAGLFKGKDVLIDAALIDSYRNMGGFDAIGSGRDKIETPEQLASSAWVCKEMELDGVVVIGGDDSNTNAAVLAEFFAANDVHCKVVGVPKTIDGDLRVPGFIDISFGFDSACAAYAELIGNVCADTQASGKYWSFVRLMGRAASNITLECALQTHPNVTLLGEEVAARRQNLASIVEEIVHVVMEREAAGLHHGVVLVPEGLVEFIPEFEILLSEINELLSQGVTAYVEAVSEALSANNAALFNYLPLSIKAQLLAERDPHGNVVVSLIETERLLAETAAHELARFKRAGKYGGHFSPQLCGLFGYEGRAGMPSDFDAEYTYALGANAAALLAHGQTGVISSVTNLSAPVSQWRCGGVPLTAMMHIERRHGKDKPVIRKALVELDALPFKTFASQRARWALSDCYRYPGPLQLHNRGPGTVTGADDDGGRVGPLCFTLALELAERAQKGLPAPPAARRQLGDLAKYTALCEGTVATEGLGHVDGHDVHRLSLYRLAHHISDEDHYAVLERLGVSRAEWAAVLARGQRQAAGGDTPRPDAY